MYATANTNNIVTENGDTFIPASQRPDGSWRKARRVKEGYVPQEEVPLYESKGKQYMNKQSKPESIVLSTGQTAHRPIPGLFIIEDKDKKTTKKKNKIKVEEVSKKLESVKLTEKTKTEKQTPKVEEKQNTSQETADPAKKLKNLKKRLREVEALEEKLKSGAITKPEPEQLIKLQRKNDLLMQIYELEKK